MSNANETLVRRFVEIVKNERRLERLGEFFAEDYIEHNQTVAAFGKGLTGYQAFLQQLFTGYPDDRVDVQLVVASGDLVAYRGMESGTNTGEFLGIPATGKRATWSEIMFLRIANGKIVERWVDVDIYSWFQQIGVIPQN